MKPKERKKGKRKIVSKEKTRKKTNKKIAVKKTRSKNNKTIDIIVGIWILLLLAVGLFAFKGAILGYIVTSEEQTFIQNIDSAFGNNENITIELDALYSRLFDKCRRYANIE